MQMQLILSLKDESKEIQTKNYTKIQIANESWAQFFIIFFGGQIFSSLDKTTKQLGNCCSFSVNSTNCAILWEKFARFPIA
jgi:hypothetical protein